MRHRLIPLAVALLAACAGPQPTPTAPTAPTPTTRPTATGGATHTASPSLTATATATATATPTPTATGTASPVPSATASTGFELQLEPFADGLDEAVFLGHAGDGSGLLYVVLQPGVIRVLQSDGTPVDAPFLDITDRVGCCGERGLLGLAFHSDHAQNGRFFVNYTDLAGDTVVAEYVRSAVDPATADPGSERVLFTIDQPYANHNGGMIAFGPDGALYIATGDGGSGGDPHGNGQNPDSLLGKMLRLDVDAAAGPDSQPSVWDLGLRNPWRFSFDRQTGDMWIGDVGQGRAEEVNAEPAGSGGRNYGWNTMEGDSCYRILDCDTTGLTLPIAWHPTHADGGCAITGGYVYRGTAIPELVGTYLFSDYCAGLVWALNAAIGLANGSADYSVVASTDLSVSSFGEDEAGELYVVGRGGQILKITGVSASPPQ